MLRKIVFIVGVVPVCALIAGYNLVTHTPSSVGSIIAQLVALAVQATAIYFHFKMFNANNCRKY